MARVRLDEMAAVVKDDVPTARLPGMALDVVHEQRLGEIVAVEGFAAGRFENRTARGVVDLPRVRRERPVGASLKVSLLHDHCRRVLERQQTIARAQRLRSAQRGAVVANLGRALFLPFRGRLQDQIGEAHPDTSRGRATEDLPRSRKSRRGAVTWTQTMTGSPGPANWPDNSPSRLCAGPSE